jgi:hypothetical protein
MAATLQCGNILQAPGYRTDYQWLQQQHGMDTLSVQLLSENASHLAGCFRLRLYSEKQPAPHTLVFANNVTALTQGAASASALANFFAVQRVWYSDPIGYAMPGSHQRGGPQLPANHRFLPSRYNGNSRTDTLISSGCGPALAAFNLQGSPHGLCWIDNPGANAIRLTHIVAPTPVPVPPPTMASPTSASSCPPGYTCVPQSAAEQPTAPESRPSGENLQQGINHTTNTINNISNLANSVSDLANALQ